MHWPSDDFFSKVFSCQTQLRTHNFFSTICMLVVTYAKHAFQAPSRTRDMRMIWRCDQACGQGSGLLGRCLRGESCARRAREAHGLAKAGQLHDRQRGDLRGLWSLSSTWRGRTKWRRSLRCTQKTVGCSGRCSARHGSVLGRSWPGRGQRRAVEKCKCSRGEKKCARTRKDGNANKSMHLRVPGWQAHNGRSME